jgi:hypothetical protein
MGEAEREGQGRSEFEQMLCDLAGRNGQNESEQDLLTGVYRSSLGLKARFGRQLRERGDKPLTDEDFIRLARETSLEPSRLAAAFTATDEEVAQLRGMGGDGLITRAAGVLREAPEHLQRAVILSIALNKKAKAEEAMTLAWFTGASQEQIEQKQEIFDRNQAIIDRFKMTEETTAG